MSQYFPPYRSSGRNIEVELDLSSCATKTDFKNVTHVDVTIFALKTNLANLKTEVNKIYITKLTPVPDDLAKLNNLVKNDVVKKTEYDKLVAKVDNIDTTGFVLKTTYDTDKSDLKKKISDVDKKIPDTSGLVKKTDDNSKITEIENKISSITGLATNSALAAVENKIELKEISDRVTSNKTKHLLVGNKLKKLKTFDSIYFKGKGHFEEDSTQNYLVFQPKQNYFKRIAGVGSGNYIYFC